MALSDADVQKQIKHMMAFIEQEANEKAEEIDAKAEEEFNIEKGRLVQHQRLKIMEYYERKEKQVELQKKIQSSNMLNQARLKRLKVREDHVRNVLDDARHKMAKISANQSLYAQILENLIVQAVFQVGDMSQVTVLTSCDFISCNVDLLEPNVVVRVREEDVEIVKSVLPRVVARYKEEVGREMSVRLDVESFLPAESGGGVELLAQAGRIKIANTLESRLDLIALQLVPQIRGALFGINPNRKFTD